MTGNGPPTGPVPPTDGGDVRAPEGGTAPDPTPPDALPDGLLDGDAGAVEEVDVPLFGSWGRWYAVVLGNLVLLILLFYWFTKAYD